jgi:hypothetical protein
VQGIAKYSLELNGGNAASTLVSATPTLLPAQVRHWVRFPVQFARKKDEKKEHKTTDVSDMFYKQAWILILLKSKIS